MNRFTAIFSYASRFALCGALTLCALSAATAQTTPGAAPSTAPSRLRFDSLADLKAKASETIDVELDGATLQMATKFAGTKGITGNLPPELDEATLRELLANLQGVYVKGFEFKQPGAYTEANLAPLRTQLTAPGSGWSRVVAVNNQGSGGETIEVYAANDPQRADRLSGLAVIIQEPKELMIVNIIGSIDAETVVRLASKFATANPKSNTPAATPKNK